MDGNHFDDLSRKLAAGVSRRAALTGTAAALLGALGLRRQTEAQVSQAQCGNVTCKNNPGKCNPGCVCCVWGNGNTRCMPPGSCTGTPTCPPGQVPDPVLGCVAPTTTTTTTSTTTTTTSTTTAAPQGLPLQAVCTSAAQCDQSGGTTNCEDNICSSDGGPFNCCRPVGGTCGEDCNCCGLLLCNGGICS